MHESAESEFIMNTISIIVNALIAEINNTETKDVNTLIDNVKTVYNVNTDIATIATALTIYHLTSATDKYIIVAENKNAVFFKHYNFFELLSFDCFNSTYSSNNEYTIRLKVSKELKKDILLNGHKLADIEEKERLKNDFNLNNGQISEMLVKKYFNITYHCDNLPYYQFGDIDLCFNTYQIKSHKATFCSIEQLKRYIDKYGIRKQHNFKMPVLSEYNYNKEIAINTNNLYTDIMNNTREQYTQYSNLFIWYCCIDDLSKRFLEKLTSKVFEESDSISYYKLVDIAHYNGFNAHNFIRLLIEICDFDFEEE
jgi:hypothetical protein